MKKHLIPACFGLILPLALVSCGGNVSSGYSKNTTLGEEPVTLQLCGSTASFSALQKAAVEFQKIYPNVTINYEYVQNYADSMATRLADTTPSVDLFINNGVKTGSGHVVFRDYCLDFKSKGSQLNLSDCFDGIITNLTDTDGGLYSIPLGCEGRGLFVNTTFLKDRNIATPTNWSEFSKACEKLYADGYTPLQGNPATFGITFMYPYIANLIANATDSTVYTRVANRTAGVSEVFREAISRFYSLVSSKYYEYKKVEQTYGSFTKGSEDAACQAFLGIKSISGSSTTGTTISVSDSSYLGSVAFMPGTCSLKTRLNQYIEDYHMTREYEFIATPLGDEGGYAYLSPSTCISINKAISSVHQAWSLEFLNYIFSKAVNKMMAPLAGWFPNTSDVMDYLNENFHVPANRACQVGQVTFDYNFYTTITPVLIAISKDNNTEKWVTPHPTDRMYTLNEFMAQLETALVPATSSTGA